jgi:hypothetical protein
MASGACIEQLGDQGDAERAGAAGHNHMTIAKIHGSSE